MFDGREWGVYDMGENKKLVYGDMERYLAGKAQMKVFRSNQYLYWRVAAVKSMRKIILSADEFYCDLEDELSFDKLEDVSAEDQADIVNNEIRNGWLFEAVSQAEQSIEDLFSLLRNSGDIAYFAKNVVNYNATKVKKYIWEFKTDEIEYIMQEFKLPYFSLDDPWENQEVFDYYRKSVLLIQQYLQELIAFHKKYYLDYCQYKHGMSVALCPFGKHRTKSEEKGDLRKGVLMTFDSYTVDKRYGVSGELPQMAMCITPEIGSYVSRLHQEGNLLHYSMHVVNIDEVVRITEKAFTLFNIVWTNLLKRCELTDEDEINEWAFPLDNPRKYFVIEFPIQPD
ncbi:MAG: hypothetical protein K2N63_01590 [Lachnospiraceae bacterium]|nr:hypothetical protein [Lachnospiraceae bacterium]